MDDKTKQDIALLRVAILGVLLSGELDHGDIAAHCLQAAKRRWEWPDGTLCTFEARTIENWLYAYRRGGFRALMPKDRKDLGISDIRPELAELAVRAKRERPRRSINRIIKMLVRAGKAKPGELSRSSVYRLLKSRGASGRPERGPSAERRSFLHEFPGELLIGDSLHVKHPVLYPDGCVRKTYLLSEIDCATRYVPESSFAPSENAPTHERGFKQALLAHGLWLVYYVDLGSAYIARSLKIICAELGIRLIHAGAGDAAAKGAIEKWHRTWRDEVEDELPEGPIPIAKLEAIHQAWLTCDYHARVHDTTRRAPREHWLALCDHLHPLPKRVDLDELFLHRATRTVSKVGTIRWNGSRLEVDPSLNEKEIELRFDPFDPDKPPRAFVDNRFVCDCVPLDLFKNARRKRRRNLGQPDPRVEPTGISPLDDLVQEHQRLTRPSAFQADKEPAYEDESSED